MNSFEFQSRTRFVFGAGHLQQLGNLASELGTRRVLLVSDPGIIAAGHTSRAQESLERAGISVSVFDGVHENPTSHDVEVGCQFARRFEPDCLIGLGGGSSMDCAKGINFLFSNGGRMQDYWGVGKALRPMLPMIAVPTTAGTGSEAQSFALISDVETHMKMACGDKKAAFRIALLDPELTVTQPPLVTALTGIDALSHAVETFVTTRRTPASRMFSREAWKLLVTNLPRVIREPHNVEVRGALQWGACLAGLAIENSMLGATHALANPLTAAYGTVHGQAVGAMLPHVIRTNAQVAADDYAALCQDVTDHALFSEFVPAARADSAMAAECLARGIQNLVTQCGLHTQLRDLRVMRDALPRLAAEAAAQWTGQFNPCRLTASQYQQAYEAAW